MFGLSKKKDTEWNFNFHADRMTKLLYKAQDRFYRADQYLDGSGYGNAAVKMLSAQGAVAKAHSTLSEALFNVQEAVKYRNNDNKKNEQLKSIVNDFSSTKGTEIFGHPKIAEGWDNAMKQWTKEFNNLL